MNAAGRGLGSIVRAGSSDTGVRPAERERPLRRFRPELPLLRPEEPLVARPRRVAGRQRLVTGRQLPRAHV